MAPSNRLVYIVLLSTVLPASALPVMNEGSALHAPDPKLAKRGCFDWLFCRKTDSGSYSGSDASSDKPPTIATAPVSLNTNMGTSMHSASNSYDFSSGGHSRTHSEGQGGAYQLTSMSTIHETPSTEQLGQTPRPQAKLNLPGQSRHGIATVDRNKPLPNVPQGTTNKGLKSLPGQTTRSGGKPPMKPSASKPLLGRKPAGRMSPKLPGTASKKPGKTQKPGRTNNSKLPSRAAATKPVGKATAPSGAKAGARKPNSKGPRMAAVKPKQMKRHGTSNNLKKVGAKPTPRGGRKVAKRT